MKGHKRLIIHIQGAVQGVGFRPFVYNLAHQLGLTGWVSNSAQGIHIEIEGQAPTLLEFVEILRAEKPSHARIVAIQKTSAEACGYTDFEIRRSENNGTKSALILPDLAICPDCLRDILEPHNRRYRYPFTNCTHCGPRFSIIRDLPYDRANTTMHQFTMCGECQAEYDNPANRRFHAQPNACPECGPQLALWDKSRNTLAEYDEALLLAADAIRHGQIVACKGLGGFHLMVDARNESAVAQLRERKHRPHKPFATMFPSMQMLQACCEVSETEAAILQSSAAPIVLLRLREPSVIADNVAPQNPYLGVMLPYTPLHVLLMNEVGFPIVATSGNHSDEPICTDEYEALERLGDIAEMFLVHNRPIERPVDDSVVQVINGEIQVLRCARGYAPLSLEMNPAIAPTLAVGVHLKNTIALCNGEQLFLSQHIGDLENAQTNAVFQRTIADFEHLYDIQPKQVVHDLHPDYLSTQYAQQTGLETHAVQHHIAHVFAGMLDNELDAPVLGVSWDGTGYGSDGTIWGGEWFHVTASQVDRVAHLYPFPLLGGDKAATEPRRSALGVLYEVYGDAIFQMDDLPFMHSFSSNERNILRQMLQKRMNAPQTTSMGRLFDAVAAILNLCQTSTFEGQAAMAVEFEAMQGITQQHYSFNFENSLMDWRLMIRCMIDDVHNGVSAAQIAAKFHNTLAEMIVTVAQAISERHVLLTGGCFQNRLISEKTISRLRESGFVPYWHHRIPPNDGGIALGQITAFQHHVSRSGAMMQFNF